LHPKALSRSLAFPVPAQSKTMTGQAQVLADILLRLDGMVAGALPGLVGRTCGPPGRVRSHRGGPVRVAPAAHAPPIGRALRGGGRHVRPTARVRGPAGGRKAAQSGTGFASGQPVRGTGFASGQPVRGLRRQPARPSMKNDHPSAVALACPLAARVTLRENPCHFAPGAWTGGRSEGGSKWHGFCIRPTRAGFDTATGALPGLVGRTCGPPGRVRSQRGGPVRVAPAAHAPPIGRALRGGGRHVRPTAWVRGPEAAQREVRGLDGSRGGRAKVKRRCILPLAAGFAKTRALPRVVEGGSKWHGG
jgi:hypothetical protein